VYDENDDECPPDLEEVDEETRRLEELEKTKAQKQKEWLDKVVAEQQVSKEAQAKEIENKAAETEETKEVSDNES